jgi:hypothetical protein
MGAQQAEIGVGPSELLLEFGLKLSRLDAREGAFTGAEPQKQNFVVLGAFQSECTPVGAVGQDVTLDLGHLELLMQPIRIGGSEIGNQLAEELLEIAHKPGDVGIGAG